MDEGFRTGFWFQVSVFPIKSYRFRFSVTLFIKEEFHVSEIYNVKPNFHSLPTCNQKLFFVSNIFNRASSFHLQLLKVRRGKACNFFKLVG